MRLSSNSRVRGAGVSGAALVVALAWTPVAMAQDAPAADPAAQQGTETTDEGEIVVQGFRASLNTALNIKREETASVDTIVAEDIGKFPDSNLAESMQRVPGVALSRGDGGEGRNISVRGLGAQFTRVRINGMEGTAQTGSSDVYGAGNSGRSFDFNVFPTEIFSSLAVRKTTSADVEEGSLGATVDLNAPKPMNFDKDFVFSATARGVYNTISKKVDPRASLIVSKKLNDSWGVLASVAYQKRHIREVGYSAVDVLSANANGLDTDGNGPIPILPYCTPVGGFVQNGVTYVSPTTTTANSGVNIGANAANCSAGNPRTSTQAAYATVFNLRRADAAAIPGSGAFLPRLPRYVNSEQDTKRIGGTLTIQFTPDDDTDISFDMLYSRYDVERRDNYIAAMSFGRLVNELGQAAVSVRDIQFDENGSLVYGQFDGVNVRSEGLVDHFISDFKQGNLNFRHRFNDTLEITGLFGINQSVWWGPKRFQTFMDAIHTDNFTIDFRDGGAVPKIGFGFDVANPANFQYGPRANAGAPVTGGFSFQGKPSKAQTDNGTFELNTLWNVDDGLKFKVGGQYRDSDFNSYNLAPYTADLAIRPLPAGTNLASITRQISGLDNLWGNGAPASWAAIDPDKWDALYDLDAVRFCDVDCGGSRARVREEVKSVYAMATFNTEGLFPLTLRGDVGVRYVRTDMLASGYVPITAASSPTGTRRVYTQVNRGYTDWLPSANVVWEINRDLFLRLAAAKVMSRPDLPSLTPTSSITATTQSGTINNPFLEPIRADTFDASLEWYFKPGSLLSIAYFRKDIKTFVQRITSRIQFSELGLPAELLAGTPSTPSDFFNVSQPFNTPGGPLEGVEVNAQVQLDFLPGFLGNFGVLANYTRVTSTIDYCLTSVNGVCTVGTTADLIGLSKNTASGTLFYEDSKFSIRGTASYRDRYIRGIPGPAGSDLQGNSPNLFVDASASYAVTDNVKVILEAQNLTDERNNLYIDSTRRDTLFQTRIGRTFNFGVNFQF
ncbi:TonB-dependent receptor [Sphingomonas psychrotolerans]|uniref:TonB-dependent receptor n=1 Tax=Sphingomonas psychrotolerans TaxID=1327635 RepID=A0A2K8MEV8_9SPHN|nr:TonB-dependent receptor [Sphingomonas psychrotolerans]ATY32403.1 TonB-dependent receptor [Sphingomonas psychrotolerans]